MMERVECYSEKCMQYWLFKTEPQAYSIDDLKRDKMTSWTGVRNFQARNFLRDTVKEGDTVVFYHSSCDLVGAVGVAEVTKEAYPDPTQFDPESHYYDPKAKREKPQWYVVEVKFKSKFARTVSLAEMRTIPVLKDLRLLAPGNRLSLFPISKKHFEVIVKLGNTTSS